MGEVYRARDHRLDRDVAIKVLPAELTPPTPTGCTASSRRRAPPRRSTIPTSSRSTTSAPPAGSRTSSPSCSTARRCAARSAGGPLPLRKALSLAQQIARGLAAAHRRGIVHRDLKPENLFVTHDGLVKILDFGLAKLTEGGAGSHSAASSTTAAGLVLGTVGYMSPEQARGEPSDHRSDIFSFGAVLYEMLSGQRAFQGNSPVETLSAILKEQPPDLTLVVPGLSPGLARIVDRCLEKNRDDRFQTAADLRFALEAISGVSTPAVGAARRRRLPWKGVAASPRVALALGAGFALGRAPARAAAAALPAAHVPPRRGAGRAVRR